MMCRHGLRDDSQTLSLGLWVVLSVGHVQREGCAVMAWGVRYANLVSGAVGGGPCGARSVEEVCRSCRGGRMRTLPLGPQVELFSKHGACESYPRGSTICVSGVPLCDGAVGRAPCGARSL
eukprot:3313520-Pyramimonas_sp.AAC.1